MYLTIFTIIVISLFAFISSIILFSAWWSPLLGKIGFRNVQRRLGNTALVIIGSLVGAALISGSLVLYDSINTTFYQMVKKNLGETDLLISLQSKELNNSPIQTVNQKEADTLINKLKIDEVDGVMPALYLNITPVKLDKNDNPVINAYNIEIAGINFEDVKNYGTNKQKVDPVSGNNVIVSKTLASKLELKVGDFIGVPYGDIFLKLKVAQIKKDEGLIGSNRIIISIDYLCEQLKLKEVSYNEFFVSAKGGLKPDNYKGTVFQSKIEDTLKDFSFKNYDIATLEMKQQALDGYGMKSFVIMFLILSLFGIFSGILLIINIYTMLAEERKTEMGIMRAIGLTRINLMRTFIYEGYFYAVASSLVGTFVGLGIGGIMVYVLKRIFSREGGEGGGMLVFEFDFTFKSLIISFCIGFLITMFTIIFASFKSSKLNIVSAIRNTEEEKQDKITVFWVIKFLTEILAGVISILIFAGSFAIKNMLINLWKDGNFLKDSAEEVVKDKATTYSALMWYFGLILSGFFITLIINKISDKFLKKNISKYTTSIVCAFNLILTGFMNKLDSIKTALNQNEGAILFFGAGAILVISLSIFVTYNLQTIVKALAFLIKPFSWVNIVFKLAFRYPLIKPAQTARTLIMFAIVIYMIVFINVIQEETNKSIKKATNNALGGYNMLIIPGSENKVDNISKMQEKVKNVNGITESDTVLQVLITLPEYKYLDLEEASFYGNPALIPDHNNEDSFRTYYNALSTEYIQNKNMVLSQRLSNYKTDKEVWDTVIKDSSKIVIGESFYIEGYGTQPKLKLGQKIKIADLLGKSEQTKEIIGIIKSDKQGGGGGVTFSMNAYIVTTTNFAQKQLTSEYVDQFSDKSILAKIDSKKNSTKVTNSVKKALIKDNIATVMSLDDMVGTILTTIKSIMGMFTGFLAFSLIVGTSGLAIIMARSVQERRQQIGILRSLGLQKSMILLDFFIESTLITLLGIIIGVSMGILGTYITFSAVPDSKITIPYQTILGLSVLIYIFSMLFSLLPSLKAAQMKPIEATNYPE